MGLRARAVTSTAAFATTTLPNKNLVAPALAAVMIPAAVPMANAFTQPIVNIAKPSSKLSKHTTPANAAAALHTTTWIGVDLLRRIYGWIFAVMMSFMVQLIRLGPMPKHVAFVMDGNRRFARKRGMEVSKGHAEGADTLEQTLDWCLKLGVKTVSVYAFSTENFSRDKESEVDPIFKLSTEKFHKFASHSDLVKKHDIAVRVHGRLNLLPSSVVQSAGLAAKMTRNNTNATLNILMPYTSREEIAYAVKSLVRGVEDGVLEVEDIGEEVLEQCFWTGGLGEEEEGVGGGPLDVLVRTSGEVRFSDFMLWQASNSCQINFLSVYWPDFTFWHMLPALLQYQANYLSLSRSRRKHQEEAGFILNNPKARCAESENLQIRVSRVRAFLQEVKRQRLEEAIGYA